MVIQENGVEIQERVQAVTERSHSNQCHMKAVLRFYHYNYYYIHSNIFLKCLKVISRMAMHGGYNLVRVIMLFNII